MEGGEMQAEYCAKKKQYERQAEVHRDKKKSEAASYVCTGWSNSSMTGEHNQNQRWCVNKYQV